MYFRIILPEKLGTYGRIAYVSDVEFLNSCYYAFDVVLCQKFFVCPKDNCFWRCCISHQKSSTYTEYDCGFFVHAPSQKAILFWTQLMK